jgi:hypothetical protein
MRGKRGVDLCPRLHGEQLRIGRRLRRRRRRMQQLTGLRIAGRGQAERRDASASVRSACLARCIQPHDHDRGFDQAIQAGAESAGVQHIRGQLASTVTPCRQVVRLENR